jgi:CheY-like chemotaxis protein
VVLDVMMEHDFAGYEVTQVLRFQDDPGNVRPVPILMVSSIELDPATRFSRATEAPMIQPDIYLTKPLDIPRFLESVSSLLGVAGGRTASRA